jgi:hypothetical protein
MSQLVLGEMGSSDAIAVEIDHPHLPPGEPSAYASGLLQRNLPRGAATRIAHVHKTKTELGWPLEITHAIVELDGALVENRLIGIYQMLDYVAAAIVRVAAPGVFTQERDWLLGMLASGRPEWHDEEVVALAELWE